MQNRRSNRLLGTFATSVFVKSDSGADYQDLTEAIERIELQLADLKRQLSAD